MIGKLLQKTFFGNFGVTDILSALLGAGLGAATGIGSYFAGKQDPTNVEGLASANAPLASFFDMTKAQDLWNRISSARRGFGDEFVERSTSPFIAELRGALPKQIAASRAADSARGLGRSTISSSAERELGRQLDLGVNKMLSQAYLQNVQQAKTDEENIRALQQRMLEQDAAAQNNFANFGLQREGALAGIRERDAARGQQNLQTAIGAGLMTASPFFEGDMGLGKLGSIFGGGKGGATGVPSSQLYSPGSLPWFGGDALAGTIYPTPEHQRIAQQMVRTQGSPFTTPNKHGVSQSDFYRDSYRMPKLNFQE